MSHPSQTAKKDFWALSLLILSWLAPFYAFNEGYEHALTGAVFWVGVLSVLALMRLHEDCGDVVRPMITITMCIVGLAGCVAAIAGIFLFPTAIVTLSARAAIFGARDAGTLVFVYLLPAGVLFVLACRWIDERRGL